MERLESGLISPDGEVYNMEYYKLGLYTKQLCEQYVSISHDNQEQFEKFSSHYHYFNPYFDFVIFQLGYKIINPFLQKNTIGYAIGNYFITKSTEHKSRIEKYTSVSDSDLQITNYQDTSVKEGFIDPNGIGFKVNRKIDMGHPKTAQLILNQLLINNKEIYEDYIQFMTNSSMNDIPPTIENYMIVRLGFAHLCIFDTDYGNVIYNDVLNLNWIDDFQKIYQNKYKKVCFLPISEEINLGLDSIHVGKSI